MVTSVRGNHEDLCIGGLHNESYKRCHVANGGEWFYMLDGRRCTTLRKPSPSCQWFWKSVTTVKSLVLFMGILSRTIGMNLKRLSLKSQRVSRDPSELAMWGRERLNDENQQYTHVSGVDAVNHGAYGYPEAMQAR